jgi:dipeptidyl aminopeptidase/acylaminoacyl peptidase
VAQAQDSDGLGSNLIAILSTGDRKLKGGFSMQPGSSVNDFWWANDERLLVASQVKVGGLDRPELDGKLFAVNVDGSKSMVLMGTELQTATQEKFSHLQHNTEVRYFRELLYNPAAPDSRTILVSVFNMQDDQPDQAYSIDIYTGTTRLAATSSAVDGNLFADSKGQIRLVSGDNGRTGTPKVAYRPPSGDWKDLSNLIGKDTAYVLTGPAGFMPDDRHIYWYGRTASSTLGLYQLDPDDSTKQPLFEDPGIDLEGTILSFDYFRPEHVVAVETVPGMPELHVLDKDDPKVKLLAQLGQAFPGQHVQITSNTRDDALMVVLVTSDKNPGDYYLFNAKTSKADYLFSAKPDVDPDSMAPMQAVSFTARDGLLLHGYLTLPLGGAGKGLPLILDVHGGPYGYRDEWGFDPEVQLFASRGYAVLQVNYRGSGGYGLQFESLGYHNWGTTMQDDLADAVRWAVKQGYADPKRVCIYGASYGGYAALQNPIRYPGLYQCAVGYVGLYDMTLQKEHEDVRHTASGKRIYQELFGDDAVALKAISPVYNADKLDVPVFIIYGGADKKVVPENAKEMLAALDKAGKKYEPPLYEPDEGHGFVTLPHQVELYTRMLAFFDKYIGPDATESELAMKH